MQNLVVQDCDESNPLEICELRVEPVCAQEIDLKVELGLSVSEISLDSSLYRFGVRSATLALNLGGLRSKVGSKIGAHNPVAAEIELAQEREFRNKKAAAIQAFADSAKLGIRGALGASTEAVAEESRGLRAAVFHSGIRAQTHDKWKLEDPREKDLPLEATILNGASLCVLQAKPHANRYACEIVVYAAPAEFHVSQKLGNRRPSSVNRERIIGIIATRSVSGAERYDAATTRGVVLSKADLVFEERLIYAFGCAEMAA